MTNVHEDQCDLRRMRDHWRRSGRLLKSADKGSEGPIKEAIQGQGLRCLRKLKAHWMGRLRERRRDIASFEELGR